MRHIKDKKTEDGKVSWLVAWEGENPETGRGWDDSWEPTRNITPDRPDRKR